MFLTKKQRVYSAAIIALVLIVFAGLCVYCAANREWVNAAIFAGITGALAAILLRYGSPAGNRPLKEANELIFTKCDPAAALELLKGIVNDEKYVVRKPGAGYYDLLYVAYFNLYDLSGAKNALDMYEAHVKSAKAVPYVLDARAGLAYRAGNIAEGDRYTEAVLAHPKTDAFLRDLAQKRRRGLRAAAAGDWDTAIEFYSKEVEMDSEKNSAVTPNLEMGKLWNRYHLGKALYSAGRASEALPHLRYCAENGGTTFMRAGARDMLDEYENTFARQ